MAGETHQISDGSIRIEYPDKAHTYGVGPCLAIGILNGCLRVGYLGHYLTGELSQVEPFKEMLDQAKSEARKLSDLEVALAGTVPLSRRDVMLINKGGFKVDFQECLEDLVRYRKLIRNILWSSGITPNRVKDLLENEPGDYDYSMTVDTEKGEIIVERIED